MAIAVLNVHVRRLLKERKRGQLQRRLSGVAETLSLPCPFCDGDVDPEGWLGIDGIRGPECEDCGATTPTIKVWNRRVTPSKNESAAVALRAAVRAMPNEMWADRLRMEVSKVLPILDQET